MEESPEGKTVVDYLNEYMFRDNATRPFDDPFKRKGTPPRVKTPFGVLEFKPRGLTKPLDRYKASPGSLFRFHYDSSYGDEREHDPFPYVILLAKDSTGSVFNKSETRRKDKYPSVYGKKYFYGLNLNYLRMDLAALLIEAVNIQELLGDFVSYQNLIRLNPEIPAHAFRMYYLDWCKGFRAVEVERSNGEKE